jgi:hypothetical protein
MEDRDIIFQNGPYFFGSRGMYLNRWTLDFNLEHDVPSTVPIWMWIPHLPLHCWSDDGLHIIGNSLGCYMDRVEPKENMYAYARIYALRWIWRKAFQRLSSSLLIIGSMCNN